MNILKRDQTEEVFDISKIANAIRRAFISTGEKILDKDLHRLTKKIETEAKELPLITVESIQDLVEKSLMSGNYYRVAKNYILYREKRSEYRTIINKFYQTINNKEIISALKDIQATFSEKAYSLDFLYSKYQAFYKPNADTLEILTKGAVELVSPEAPNWEFIAARLLLMQIEKTISKEEAKLHLDGFYSKIAYLTNEGLYGRYILDNYTKEEIDELEYHLDYTRDHLLTYSSLHLVSKRYLITDTSHVILERPQEMFMGIAMHLAIPEGENRVVYAKKIYDILSRLQVTMATPTMSNARKPLSQLSSCFEDVMPDSLNGIYRTIDNFAQVSKFGGGMGIYMGKIRAVGSDIRGFKGVAGGVLKWIKLCNDTAVAVDQLGVRQGSVAVYLDIWHRDIPEFLQIRTNNGDDRMKAHDVFPGVCVPDLFWKMLKENIEGMWYMMCPHEIQSTKGYHLEDFWGEEWERRYNDCINDNRIAKREIKVKDLIRLIIKSAVETGTPFIFNRDTVNRTNPNKHQGIIYSSNLCTEIAQNQSEIKDGKLEVKLENGQEVVTKETHAGDFVVCNLASLVLGNINVDNNDELRDVIHTIVRALDNVIDLNFYPIPYAEITNMKMRPIGLGTSGYHHLLAKKGFSWESSEHLEYMDKVYERINYYAIEASANLAQEKGAYLRFPGSDWQTGDYFRIRGYESSEWKRLASNVARGMRNAYLLAIAPTSSTSIIAGTTAGIDPVMNRFFLEEKKGAIVPRVAPELSDETFWLYKTAHQIDQEWVVDAAGIRQRHLDQAQSVNLFITHDYSFRRILDLYLRAWEKGVKTLYYVRSRALEVEECENCAS